MFKKKKKKITKELKDIFKGNIKNIYAFQESKVIFQIRRGNNTLSFLLDLFSSPNPISIPNCVCGCQETMSSGIDVTVY